MNDYILEQKDSFNIVGFGTELKSAYTDLAGLNKEKSDFWQAIKEDGRLHSLKTIAANQYLFAVNEAVNNKLLHYAGVVTEKTAPEDTRIIQFPKGEYLIVKGSGATPDQLYNRLTAVAFGQILPEAKNFAYVGGPNATVEIEQRDGVIYGEIWIPIVKK
jgi:predicted transcriptional regulator YdeE